MTTNQFDWHTTADTRHSWHHADADTTADGGVMVSDYGTDEGWPLLGDVHGEWADYFGIADGIDHGTITDDGIQLAPTGATTGILGIDLPVCSMLTPVPQLTDPGTHMNMPQPYWGAVVTSIDGPGPMPPYYSAIDSALGGGPTICGDLFHPDDYWAMTTNLGDLWPRTNIVRRTNTPTLFVFCVDGDASWLTVTNTPGRSVHTPLELTAGTVLNELFFGLTTPQLWVAAKIGAGLPTVQERMALHGWWTENLWWAT